MKIWLFLSFLFVCCTSMAQQTPYQSFEVDSAAEPRGGMAYLTTFIQANLRKPIAAEAAGIGRFVIVGGTVEPDGHIANVTVMKNLRPDCDREAARVFKLFNAWKPAQKGGKTVSQQVTIPIRFTPNEPFLYNGDTQITFFDKKRNTISDSSLAVYKQITPLDSVGLPTGDIIIYEKKRKQWEVTSTIPFERKKDNPQGSADFYQQATYSIGYPSSLSRRDGQSATVNEAGRLLRRAYYQNGKRVGSEQIYYSNGVVAEQIEEVNDQISYTYWYSNGQLKQVRNLIKTEPGQVGRTEQVSAFWDSTGNQLVKKGTGHVIYHSSEKSKTGRSQQTEFTEEGNYENGLKQGIWTGRYTDGSYFYEERYDRGVCQAGKAKSAASDTLRYTAIEQMPEFQGGMTGLQQFLAENLRYPVDAQRAGAQGRVFVSFVVCTDGTLCDYEIMKGANPDLDQEAVRVVQKMSGHWKPGVQRGQKVRVKYNLPINFSLQR